MRPHSLASALLASIALLPGCGLGLDGFKGWEDSGLVDDEDGFGGFDGGSSGGTGGDGGSGDGGSGDGGSGDGGSGDGGSGPVDNDGDGYTADIDCDDVDQDTFPGAAPRDSATACMRDRDGDDWGDQYVETGITPGTDCNDGDATTSPADADGDGWSTCDGDCDDADSGRSPGTPEVAFDGIDQDCSGADSGTIVTASGSTGSISDYTTTWGYATASGCGTVLDIEVTVDITHSYAADLGIAIHEPSGLNFATLQYYSFTNDNGYGISGTWSSRGTGSLSAYESLSYVLGGAGSGQWALEIYDEAYLDTGSLNSWSVTLYCL